MSRSVHCECGPRFTCRRCLQNARPYFFTCADGSAIVVGPLQRSTQQEKTTNEQFTQHPRHPPLK